MKIELQNKLLEGECGWDKGEHRVILDEVDKKDWGEKCKKTIYGYDQKYDQNKHACNNKKASKKAVNGFGVN